MDKARMDKTSQSKIKVQKITQVAIVVHDLQMIVENYWNILGIGPWNIYAWEYPTVYNRTYYSKPAWSREIICHAMVGDVELELMQPIDGPSIYRDFLEKYGEGIHHLQFLVDDLDRTVNILTKEYGFVNLQGGSCGRTERGCRYNYIYIEPLGCIWEIGQCLEGIGTEPTSCYPENTQGSPARFQVNNINQLAIVVRDVKRTAQNYWNILGIGPWAFFDWESPFVYNRKYHGRPSFGRERIALADIGGVQLELLQPIEGESIYQDFLNEHGEGLHHISSIVGDVNGAVEILAKDGFPSIQSGCFGPHGSGNIYNYIDIKNLRAIWELAYYDVSNLGVEPVYYP